MRQEASLDRFRFVGWRVRIVAILLLVSGTTQAAQAGSGDVALPVWLLGTWDVVDVHQSDAGPSYQPGDDPKHWYAGKTLTITSDLISFGGHECRGPQAAMRYGKVGDVLKQSLHTTVDHTRDYGMPRDSQTLPYLVIHCALLLADMGDGTPPQPTDQKADWYVVLRSHGFIEMPFYAASYVAFRKPSPTS